MMCEEDFKHSQLFVPSEEDEEDDRSVCAEIVKYP